MTKAEIVSASQMFLVPSSIMFAALGVAGSEALKTLICAMGATTSYIWLGQSRTWEDADVFNLKLLAGLFLVAWCVCFLAHFYFGLAYRWTRKPDVQRTFQQKEEPEDDANRILSLWKRMRSKLA